MRKVPISARYNIILKFCFFLLDLYYNTQFISICSNILIWVIGHLPKVKNNKAVKSPALKVVVVAYRRCRLQEVWMLWFKFFFGLKFLNQFNLFSFVSDLLP